MTVQQLNQHPLNRAALQRLRREGGQYSQRCMHILSLAEFGLESPLVELEGEPAEDDDPRRLVIQSFSRHPLLQRDALAYLIDCLEPEEVLAKPLGEVADRVGACLLPYTEAFE